MEKQEHCVKAATDAVTAVFSLLQDSHCICFLNFAQTQLASS